MRRKSVLFMTACLAGAVIVSGCSGKQSGQTSQIGTENATDYRADDYVKLGDYKGLSAQYPIPEVSDDDLKEAYIDDLLSENAEYREITDRASQVGDSVNIDFKGTVDGEEFDGGTGEDYDLVIGDGDFLEEFEENLVGRHAGDTFTFTVTFPEDYDDVLGGKEAEFSVTMNTIEEVILPEYNDELIASATDYKTVAEYEDAARKELMEDTKEESYSAAAEDLLSQAVENASFNGYPQALYDSCYAEVMDGYNLWADMYDVEVDELLSDYFMMTEEDIEEEVIDSVHERLVVQAIADAEGIAITDENYEAEASAMLEEYGYDTLEEFEKDYGRTSIMDMILREKVLDFLYESANIEEVSMDEYYGEDEEE